MSDAYEIHDRAVLSRGTGETLCHCDADEYGSDISNEAERVCAELNCLRAALDEAHMALSTIGAAARIAMTKDESSIINPPEALAALKKIATAAYQTRDKLDVAITERT